MQEKRFPVLVHALALLSLSCLLSGCILPSDSTSSGVKLSDAMKTSASGGGKTSSSGSSQDYDGDVDVGGGTSSFFGSGFMGASYDRADYGWQLPADVTYSIPFNGDIRSLTHFTLTPLSIEGERGFLGIYAGAAIVDFESGSLPDLATECPLLLESGVTFRLYFTDSTKAFSPYATARAGYDLLAWTYRNAIIIGNDKIRGDELNAVEGYIGFGISTRRDKRLSAFAEVGIGGTVFFNTTNEGLDNDVFDNFGFASFKAGISLKF